MQLLLAAQDQVLSLRWRQHSRKQQILQLCRPCDKFHEIVAHITSEYPQLAEYQYIHLTYAAYPCDLSKVLKGNNKIDIHDIVKRIKKALDK